MAHATTLTEDRFAARSIEDNATTDQATQRRWRGLYRVAGVGALLTAILIPLQIVVFIAWPPPLEGEVTDWFALFTANPLLGLVHFDLAILLEEALLVPIVLALYVVLRRASESLMLIVAGLFGVSIALFIGSNTGFEMLALSRGYAGATSDAERILFLAAGQAMVASYMEQGSAFVVGYLLASVAGIGVGIAMLRSRVFNRWAGYAAIVGNALGFGLFIPVIGVPMSIVAVLVLIAWYALIGVGLWRLSARPAEVSSGSAGGG